MPEILKKNILLIDDDEEDFLLLRDIFKEFYSDVELQWCKDGEEALTLLLRANDPKMPKPHIILLDLNMPKLNGREVLSEIRKSSELKHIPVVVLSNSMNKKEAVETYLLGVNSFIRKPAGYRELRDFVQVFYKYWFVYSASGLM